MQRTIMKFALLAAMILGVSAGPPAVAGEVRNFTGVWEIYPDPPPPRRSHVPNGGPKLREPYATQWQAFRVEREKKLKEGTPLVDGSTLCLPEGMPTVMWAIYPLQIVQTPGQVIVLAEYLTQTRRIFIDMPMPADDDIAPSYFGFSVGRWEGDTLVVTTKGVREDVTFFDIPHSSEMTITERIRLRENGELEDQFTIDDPKMLLEPYTFTYGYRRNDEYRIMEFYCEPVDPLTTINEDGTISMKVDQNVD